MGQELPAEGVVLGWRPPGQGGTDRIPVGSMEHVEDLGRGDPGEGGPCLAMGSAEGRRHPLGRLQAGGTLPPSGGLEGKCGWPKSQARLCVIPQGFARFKRGHICAILQLHHLPAP